MLRGETSEDIIDLSATGEIATDAETESGIVGIAEFGSDVFQAVVSGIATAATHAYSAEGESEVVDDDEKILKREFLLIHPESDGHATEIHKCRWLEYEEFAVFYFDFSHVAVSAGVEVSAGLGHESVGHHKSDVVTCIYVFRADVAEPDNEETFHSILIYCESRLRRHFVNALRVIEATARSRERVVRMPGGCFTNNIREIPVVAGTSPK